MPSLMLSAQGSRQGPEKEALIDHVECLESRLMELETREYHAGDLRATLVRVEAERDKSEAMHLFWRAYAADLERTLTDVCQRLGLAEPSEPRLEHA